MVQQSLASELGAADQTLLVGVAAASALLGTEEDGGTRNTDRNNLNVCSNIT